MYKSLINNTRLVSVFRRQFELCCVKPGEKIVFLTDQTSNRSVVLSGMQAAAEIGNLCFEVSLPGPISRSFDAANTPISSEPVMSALLKSDLVICFFPAFFTAWEARVKAAGVRILSITDCADQLVRLQSTPAVKAAVLGAYERVKKTREVHVTSEAGTDFSWIIDHEQEMLPNYGYADEPGRSDSWCVGYMNMFSTEGGANGRVVAQPGDVWIAPFARLIQGTIEIEVKDGFIESVNGQGIDARAFRNHLQEACQSPEDRDPYAISHLGWGLKPTARWDDMMKYEHGQEWLAGSLRSFPGHFLFSTGPSWKRHTLSHIDMPMCECTIRLDGDVIIDKGRIVDPAMIADPRRTYL